MQRQRKQTVPLRPLPYLSAGVRNLGLRHAIRLYPDPFEKEEMGPQLTRIRKPPRIKIWKPKQSRASNRVQPDRKIIQMSPKHESRWDLFFQDLPRLQPLRRSWHRGDSGPSTMLLQVRSL